MDPSDGEKDARIKGTCDVNVFLEAVEPEPHPKSSTLQQSFAWKYNTTCDVNVFLAAVEPEPLPKSSTLQQSFVWKRQCFD